MNRTVSGVLLTLLLMGTSILVFDLQLVFCQEWSQPQNLQPQHPKDLSGEELQKWYQEQEKIDKALGEVEDPNVYKAGEYECNKFSDFTASELAKKGFNVKRATNNTHHWVFVIVRVDNKEIWVPIECTPPAGQKQKDKTRPDWNQWPKVPLLSNGVGKFDEKYFQGVKVKNVKISDSTKDLKYIYTGKPVLKPYYGYIDVVEAHVARTEEYIVFNIIIVEGIPSLNLTTFWTVMVDRNNDPEDNSQDYPTEDVDTMYSVIYDSTTAKWKIERAIYQTWGWDVTPTKAIWGMISAWPNGQVTIQVSIPLSELSETLPRTLRWKVITETFNGASIGDFVPEERLSYAYIHPDDMLPIVTIVSPSNETYRTMEINLSVIANEPISTFTYSLNHGKNVTFFGDVVLRTAYAYNKLIVYARDLAGNVGFNIVTFEVKFLEDLNGDGVVNIIDVTIVARAFRAKLGDPNWNEVADLNKDGWINIIDIATVARNYGKTT